MHPEIKGLECPERSLPKAIWARYPQSSGHSYVSLTDKGSQLLNRNLSKASFHRLTQESLAMPQSQTSAPHIRSAAAHNPSAPLDAREAAQSQECDGASIYSPRTNALEV